MGMSLNTYLVHGWCLGHSDDLDYELDSDAVYEFGEQLEVLKFEQAHWYDSGTYFISINQIYEYDQRVVRLSDLEDKLENREEDFQTKLIHDLNKIKEEFPEVYKQLKDKEAEIFAVSEYF